MDQMSVRKSCANLLLINLVLFISVIDEILKYIN